MNTLNLTTQKEMTCLAMVYSHMTKWREMNIRLSYSSKQKLMMVQMGKSNAKSSCEDKKNKISQTLS